MQTPRVPSFLQAPRFPEGPWAAGGQEAGGPGTGARPHFPGQGLLPAAARFLCLLQPRGRVPQGTQELSTARPSWLDPAALLRD